MIVKLKNKPAYVLELEKALDDAHLRWAKELDLKVVTVKDTYGELPGVRAFVMGETPSKLNIIRPIVSNEESWNIQKASVTEESLKAAGIKYSH